MSSPFFTWFITENEDSFSTRNSSRPSVFFDHALFLGGDLWFDGLPADKRLPFILADDGFDIWIGNHRGTEYSPDNIYYPRDTFAFWDFSFDALAKYDVPSMVEFILNATNKPQIHYVGYNQGAMLPLALASQSPNFVNALASTVLIAPIVFLGNISSPVLNSWGNNFSPDQAFYETRLLNGVYNLSNTVQIEGLLNLFGFSLSSLYGSGTSEQLFNDITGPNCCISETTFATFQNQYSSNWVVASYRNLVHYQQEIRSGRFQYWDFLNDTQDLTNYGVTPPPSYEITNIPATLPIFLISGAMDYFADSRNIELLARLLPSAVRLTVPNYAHLDLMLSDAIVEDVYSSILEYLNSGYTL